jgi:hypothetical protein
VGKHAKILQFLRPQATSTAITVLCSSYAMKENAQLPNWKLTRKMYNLSMNEHKGIIK